MIGVGKLLYLVIIFSFSGDGIFGRLTVEIKLKVCVS